ncbi:MAG: chemotaxis protein CheW [Gammaproteobacteria bacterium]
MNTDAISNAVRSLWVPLQGANILIPNIAIIEVIGYRPYELIDSTDDWMMGSLRWRGKYLPVVSMESLCGEGLPVSTGSSRLAIINSTRSDTAIDFFAVVTADIPRLIHVSEGMADVSDQEDELSDTVICKVTVDNEEAIIPDLEKIQLRVNSAWLNLI